jgi:putative PIN family toxin of toxin-antitoxin system
MSIPQIILDTNIVVSGLRSRRGASFKLLSLIGSGKFDLHLSTPLVLEYEDVLLRQLSMLPYSSRDIQDFLDYLCSEGEWHEIYFLWRPFLKDPKDDLVLEVAVTAQCNTVVSFNKKDFKGSEQFGIQVLSPGKFLKSIGEIP